MGGSVRSCGVLLGYYYYVLLYCCSTGLWVGRSVRSCGVLLGCVSTGSWVILIFIFFLPLYRPRACIVQRTTINSITSKYYQYRTIVLIYHCTVKNMTVHQYTVEPCHWNGTAKRMQSTSLALKPFLLGSVLDTKMCRTRRTTTFTCRRQNDSF